MLPGNTKARGALNDISKLRMDKRPVNARIISTTTSINIVWIMSSTDVCDLTIRRAVHTPPINIPAFLIKVKNRNVSLIEKIEIRYSRIRINKKMNILGKVKLPVIVIYTMYAKTAKTGQRN